MLRSHEHISCALHGKKVGKKWTMIFLVRLGTNLFFSISKSWYVRRSTNTESDSCRIADRSIFTNTVNVLKLPVLRVISSISAKKKGGLRERITCVRSPRVRFTFGGGTEHRMLQTPPLIWRSWIWGLLWLAKSFSKSSQSLHKLVIVTATLQLTSWWCKEEEEDSHLEVKSPRQREPSVLCSASTQSVSPGANATVRRYCTFWNTSSTTCSNSDPPWLILVNCLSLLFSFPSSPPFLLLLRILLRVLWLSASNFCV